MFMDEKNAISGKQARAFAIIDNNQEELFYAKSLEASIEKNKVDVPVVGRTNTPQRSSGWNGTGTLTIYYLTTMFRRLMVNYIKTGRDFYFDLQVVNDDPSSNAGKQTILLKNCNLDSVIIARFDATSDDMLEEELPFTFSDVEILDSFNTPQAQ